MDHLVIGCGEVGKALMEVLDCPGYDPQKGYITRDDVTCDIMHVCIPYSEGERPLDISTNVVWQPFAKWVSDYQELFKPKFTVIHSTVPIGTSDSLGALHSPVRGKHPHLVHSLRTFEKYVGGEFAKTICDAFDDHGISAVPCRSARDTEAGKLIDLMQFGQAVLLEKAIHEFCEANNLNFDLVYRHFNQTYNHGFKDMALEHFTRPILDHVPGPIGGHCVAQNMKWLNMTQAEDIWYYNKAQETQKEPA